MTAASTRIVSRPSRSTRIALLITTVVWLRRCPGGQRGRVGGAALGVPAEHHGDHRDREHHRRPHIEGGPLALAPNYGALVMLAGCLGARHRTISTNSDLLTWCSARGD